MASERLPMKPVDGWVIVTRHGQALACTAARTRKSAMERYCDDNGEGFKLDQRRFGVRCERMTIVPREAPDGE